MAEYSDCYIDQGLYLIVNSDIGNYCNRRPAPRTDFLDHFVSCIGIQIGHSNCGAFLGKPK